MLNVHKFKELGGQLFDEFFSTVGVKLAWYNKFAEPIIKNGLMALATVSASLLSTFVTTAYFVNVSVMHRM